ncbi:hypothetical protein [Nonomuraea pusilla]|uniref:Uncharacterized protein n=1 Tax=Nonomuraea pusilla TaxID=46177 RepID=A0A1H8IS81_9ACTN|nr:hypothetical protein [Nonomuraea pusilla]SEN70965.1 hypothetical protein SAMN05660976_08130 [Nonomuraea pusilla]
MADDQTRLRRERPRKVPLVTALAGAVAVGGAFGAATGLVNALSFQLRDFESRADTTGGVSPVEIASVLIDSGWAWAGLAVAVGWLFTRSGERLSPALARAAAVGALALLAATAAYSVVDTVRNGTPLSSWYRSEAIVWWVTSVVFGAPLGAVGGCARRPGVIGLLARATVPVGAAVQMLLQPPGRNERIELIGQAIVLTAAAVALGLILVRFLGERRRRAAVCFE